MSAESRKNKYPKPHLLFEQDLWACGICGVAGIDEAGRGAWAGPVFAAAVILPADLTMRDHLSGVRDSKQMSPAQRSRWAEQIKMYALTWGVGQVSSEDIDATGILPATRLAMQRAIQHLSPQPQHLLLDYVILPEYDLPQTALVKGDRQSLSIAAASVLAKTARDALMMKMDERYPRYGFARHKGYGTARHRLALQENGLCTIHRRNFKPMKDKMI